MLADKFKNGKPIDLEKHVKAYIIKHYGNLILTQTQIHTVQLKASSKKSSKVEVQLLDYRRWIRLTNH
jgi:hypothetical protein